ncbi:MAG: hypothetical protein Q9M43_09860 [Sulfurimonas sp.]|nr:hypothetical protein [Sulfurimonas sp.]
MTYYTAPSFWMAYDALPKNTQDLADKNFELLKENRQHLSLHFKKINKYYSARVGIYYRTLAVEVKDGLLWFWRFWIGNHSNYDKLIN